MQTTLVMHNKDKKYELSKLVSEHQDWKVIEADDYYEALNIIQSGHVDALALGQEVSCEDCMGLVSTMNEENPNANIYVIMEQQAQCDVSRSCDRGFLYA